MGAVKHNSDLQTPPGEEGAGRHSRRPLLLRHAVARPARVSEGARRHRGQRERRVQLLAQRAEGVFLPRRAVAGRQRAASGTAGASVRHHATANRAVRSRQSGEPWISHGARSRHGTASAGRSGAAPGHASHRLQADARRSEAVSRFHGSPRSHHHCCHRRCDARTRPRRSSRSGLAIGRPPAPSRIRPCRRSR